MTAETCAYHARRQATSSCVSCGRPLCRDCMRQTAVGFKCADCTGPAPKPRSAARSRNWPWVAGLAGAALAALAATAFLIDGGTAPSGSAGPVAEMRHLEVSFQGAAGYEMAAVVDVPGGTGPHPAVVVVPGLGATTRDGVVVDEGVVDALYRDLADALVEEGILVLRYDRRGTGHNAAPPGEITFEQETEDAVRAVAHVRGRSDVDPQAVGLVGHGGGGIVGLRIADHALDLDAMALVNTPGRPLGEVLVGEFMAIGDEAHMEGGRQLDAAIQLLLETGEVPEVENGMAAAVFRLGDARYLRELFAFEPAEAATRVVSPVLLVHGEEHSSVLDRDVEALEEALHQAPEVEAMHVVGVGDTLARETEEEAAATPAPDATEHGGQMHGMEPATTLERDHQALRRIAAWMAARLTAGDAIHPSPAPDVTGGTAAGWSETAGAPLEPRTAPAVAWSGEELLLWGGAVCTGACTPETAQPVGDGAAYDPVTDTWRALPQAPLTPRFDTTGATRTWAGFMVVWGGDGGDGYLGDGALYDPASDAWRPMADGPLAPRSSASSTWTGSEILIWGGTGPDGRFADGAAYDPAADSWRSMAAGPLGPRLGPAAAWTGEELVVWGGAADAQAGEVYGDGAAYDPATDTWRELAQAPLTPRRPFRSAWTGRELLVFGGEAGDQEFTDGAAYDPASDSWRPLASSPVVTRRGATTVWTGTELIVGGGFSGGEQQQDGAVYDPAEDRWRPLGSWQAPINATSWWTGDEVLLWGGLVPRAGGGFETVGIGLRFDPDA